MARPISTTAIWLGRYRSCGSRVRLPTRITLLKFAILPAFQSQIANRGSTELAEVKLQMLVNLSPRPFPPHRASAGGCGQRRARNCWGGGRDRPCRWEDDPNWAALRAPGWAAARR